MISKLFGALFLIDVIYCVNYTQSSSNFLYKYSNNRAIEAKQVSAFDRSAMSPVGARPRHLSRVENSRRLAKPRIKVYRLNNSFIKHLRVNRTNTEPKDSLKISLRNPNLINRLNQNVAKRMPALNKEKNFVHTREKPFDQEVAFHLEKSNPAINFLSNVNFYLTKLQKEAENLEPKYKLYGRRFFYLVKYRLKKTYEELRANLCSNVLDTDEDIDDDFGDMDGYRYTFINSNNIFEKMRRNERRRTIRAKNEKRLIRKICN